MLQQEILIQATRELCQEDKRIVAAAMYGSFTRGEGDQFSDIEFYLFVDDGMYEAFDLASWIAQIGPVDECFQNEFGTTIALFSNLIRGEFHLCSASSMSQVRNWGCNVRVKDIGSMVVVDRTGELAEHLTSLIGSEPDRTDPEEEFLLIRRYLDWMIFGTNVLRRGEYARALELLWFVQRHLLWMARILEKTTEHYPTPSKALEADISVEAYERYKKCTAVLNPGSLDDAYKASWSWGKELIAALIQFCGVQKPEAVMMKLDERFIEWYC